MPASPVLWLQQQRRLLELEYEYEKTQFRTQTEIAGITRKIKQGLCWYPLSFGKSYYNSLNQLVIEVERTEHTEEDHASSRANKCVSSHKMPPESYDRATTRRLHYFHFTGTVSFVDGNTMVVALPDTETLSHLRGNDRVGAQLYLDETTYA